MNINLFKSKPYKKFNNFEELYAQAEKRMDYKIEGLKNKLSEFFHRLLK